MNVHLIFNAHIDPIWLWPWESGLDEVLATCRSACDRLDAHPDLRFARGEAWVYQQVEQIDPELFARIRKHVASGQWEITGGWWIQPDCNLPSGFALERQIGLGKAYFESRFGAFPRIAFNVDSFGHAATLPALLRQFGQDRYVMMRPQEHEMALPARLFRWRGYEDGPEVVTFRIANSYTSRDILDDHVRASLTELPPGVEETMCFVGVGDHGGGPTEKQIAWCREHETAFPGHRLLFSTPGRYFEAIAPHLDSLPLVTGELQQHAIGCYSVHRAIKTGVRRAEQRLRQAEIMQQIHPDPAVPARLEAAWERVCFHHFHDTLGGTCLPSAYPQADAQLGYALAVADETLQIGLRRKLTTLPDAPRQRIALANASDAPFHEWVEFEPWLDWLDAGSFQAHWRLTDAQGQTVPFQLLQSEALMGRQARLLFKIALEPGEVQTLQITPGPADPPLTKVWVLAKDLIGDNGVACTANRLQFPHAPAAPLPRLELYEDASDTWSHNLDRYASAPIATAAWDAPVTIDNGPLLASQSRSGKVGGSSLRAEWRLYADESFVDLRLSVHWQETHKLLKLTLPFPARAVRRTDGISGGQLERPADGREMPLRDWTLLELEDHSRIGVVCPDVFALDVTPERVRLTLLRSAVMAHHVPHSGVAPRRVISDQGVHEFRFRFYASAALRAGTLEMAALAMQRPLVIADLTRGMPLYGDRFITPDPSDYE